MSGYIILQLESKKRIIEYFKMEFFIQIMGCVQYNRAAARVLIVVIYIIPTLYLSPLNYLFRKSNLTATFEFF